MSEPPKDSDLVKRIEHIQGEVKRLEADLADKGVSLELLRDSTYDALFGKRGDEESREKSVMGRLKAINGELEALKKAQAKGERDRERYVTGGILAALGTAVGWAVSRILGGGG